MAETLGASVGGIEEAMKNIKDKKAELETQANGISTAFTNLTETIQLNWLNTLIRDSWNVTGNGIVENAQTTMSGLISDLEEIQSTAEEISQG